MGTFIFIVLHLVAVFTGFWLLIITIPLHLIYSSTRGRDPDRNVAKVRCPSCRELVRHDALKCKHCGQGLTPQ